MLPIKIKMNDSCDHQQKKSLLANLLDLRYQPDASIKGFYNQYRNVVMACLKKKGDVIFWQNNTVLTNDEQLSPTFEELILANVLGLIDVRLLGHVKDKYSNRLGDARRSLMDYQADILSNVPNFLTELENNLLSVSKTEENLLFSFKSAAHQPSR
jgi:hypothetical protein